MNKNARRYLNHRRRLRLAQGGLCAGCADPLPGEGKRSPRSPLYPTFDHVVPRSRGGRRNLDNGLLKHKRCNEAKGDAPPTGCDLVWLGAVRARMRQNEPVTAKQTR